MGHIIERIAQERGHEIVARIDVDNIDDIDGDAFRTADAAIEFTMPTAAEGNVRRALKAGVPVVSGTTGWYSALPALKAECEKGNGSLMAASNFSIGVNIFRQVNAYLARIMEAFPQYKPEMTEIHHIHKLDHPSGTAITLAETISENNSRVEGWEEPAEGSAATEGKLPIRSVREGEVPGVHTVRWDSAVDDITLTHSAKSREGFALGAVMAAEWLAKHPGYHTIGEMLTDMTGGLL